MATADGRFWGEEGCGGDGWYGGRATALRTRKNRNRVRDRWGGATAVRPWRTGRGTRTRHRWPAASRTACWTPVTGPRATGAAWTCRRACPVRGRPASLRRCRCRTTRTWTAAARRATPVGCNRLPCARNGTVDRTGSNRPSWTSGTVRSCTWGVGTRGAGPVRRARTDTCRRTRTWSSRCTDGTFPSCTSSPAAPAAAIAVGPVGPVVAVAVACRIRCRRDDPVPDGVWAPTTRIPDYCRCCCCCPSTTPSLATNVPLPWPLRAVDFVSA